MKTRLLLFTFFGGLLSIGQAYSQCTPNNCVGSLPAYGGICDTNLTDATVDQSYSDFESFHTVSNCFDFGLINSAGAGTYVRITMVDNFSYSGMPVGISGTTNQTSYTSPSNGCVSFSGTPTEIGEFEIEVDFDGDFEVMASSSCNTVIATQNDNALEYLLRLVVLPDPSFSISETDYCLNDSPGTLSVDGTAGGTFSGPGVSGTTFDPSVAGAGSHEIWYVVSAQEGAAVSPAADSTSITVNVGPPALDIDPVSDLCMGDGVTNLTATPTGGTFSGTGVTGSDFDPGTAGVGTHTVTYDYTDGNGCSDAVTTNITVNDTAEVTGNVTNVMTSNDGAIDITVSGGAAPYSFDWGAEGNTEDLTNLGAGSYTVTVTTADGCTTTKTYTIDDVSSIASENTTQFKLFPNPTKDVINIQSELEGTYTLSIVDLNGKEVFNTQVTLNQQNHAVSVSELAPGNYSLILVDKNEFKAGQVSFVIME